MSVEVIEFGSDLGVFLQILQLTTEYTPVAMKTACPSSSQSVTQSSMKLVDSLLL